ncbi:MAG: AraC family transcriptional regulator [Treponema sp.]|jgi:AraC-like DNA-binding protein|nr:AraC family transcriptional regulator [Treponema sp.]
MPKNAELSKKLGEILPDLENFLPVRDINTISRMVMMNSLIETLYLHRLSKAGFLEKTKITGDGHIELIPRRFYAEGTQLLKPAGKSLVVSVPNFSYRQPINYTIENQPEYFRIALCRGVRGIMGGHVEKDKTYRAHASTGVADCETGVLFLPEFFDVFLNSRHSISPGEVVQAFKALGTLPMIPAAAVILKQIGEASFTGDVGNIWIEAKALELVSVILDWHRRLATVDPPPLREHDRQGIAEAIRYAEEHFSTPLTLNVLARQAAMSIRKFTAIFKTHTGLSVACYIRHLRMDQAMYLLKNTTAPLSDIAGMVGYKHQSRFSALFREQFGVMPSSFRKRE